ncbi:MAG: Arf guanine nucleotide exchange factor yel1 [Alectoria fallacina]|uniref:Arf guanine nucleotide exchange factor yel1 n=1 Tax=Alectoria fallacina TaxID=1903189 RepID=A0A8H3FR11_9LECA|nr:MAG: Arf guanine nucleotide exchange factor yel1 [Alectoria fallacina]
MNRRESPAPLVQGVAAPRPLSVRSATSNATTNEPPPQTPKSKIRTKRASKQAHRAPRETRMEDNARGAAQENIRDERISHDLSLTHNTRHSVVDNMLMSLNPDQPKSFSPPSAPPPFSTSSDLTAQPKIAPRHLRSASINSDFNFPPDDSPNRHSAHLPRGRRSHSSSTFQSGLGRIDSVHGEGDAGEVTNEKVLRTSTPSATSAARKSNKSSGSSSVDLGKMGGSSRFPHALGRRSASFDHGERIRIVHSPSSSTAQPPRPPLPSSRSHPTIYDDSDAAPTPTVPGGPRKDRALGCPPQAQTQAPTHQRRSSKASSRSQPIKKKKGDTAGREALMPSNSNAYAASRRGSKQISPMPMFLKSRNPSPVRQYSEPLMAHRLDPTVQPTIQSKDITKERPGFFRRMFGSSKDPAPGTNDLQVPHFPLLRGHTRANSREGFATPHKISKPAGLDGPLPAPLESVHPPLAKKHSSFFRRRKKSLSEDMLPPMLPLNVKSHRPPLSDPIEQSPVSSLRQVMNPFLDDPMRSNAQQFAGTIGSDFAPPHTHTLQAKGSVEPVNQNHDSGNDAAFDRHLSKVRDISASRREAHAERVHLTPDDTNSSKPHDNSFLHDDSSHESKIPGAANDPQLARQGTVSLDQPPTSFPSSLSSRKENVRPRSKPKESAESLHQRSIDSPRNRNMLSTPKNTLPASQRTAHAIPAKSEPKEWFTPLQMTPSKNHSSPPGSSKTSNRSQRVWLQPDSPEQKPRKLDEPITNDGAEVSPVSDYHSASSVQSASKPNDDIHFPEPTSEDATHKLSMEVDPNQPTEADRAQAKQLYDGDESLASKSVAAAWLGEPGPERMRVRQAYVELFDWQNLNILAALRGLCGKLYLKGEAQQVDRILDAFSNRWCSCNPGHGFKATDIVHTICYSVLLLNTDLHQAEIETKMTRQQFLKNILPTIRRVVTDAAPDGFTNNRASTLPPPRPWVESLHSSGKTSTFHETQEGRRSFEGQRPLYRLSHRPSDQTVYTSTPFTQLDYATSLGDGGPFVRSAFHGRLSTWENQIEIILKDFYGSIRQQPLPLHGIETNEAAPQNLNTSNSLSAMTNSMLRRTPSTLSKAGSENISYSRGRQGPEQRFGTGRWQSKNRSRPRLYPASTSGTVASSRRSSLDEQSSVTSPSVTSAWSKFSSFGKTQTTISIDSLASNHPQGDYQQSIGFANALSQAIIREEGTAGEEETLRAAPLLEDESLELAGAPWAKEGILKHKHHLESVDKRSKDRNWVESFAVIEKGYLRLFSFSMNAKSLRQKAKNQRALGGVVGGGNWADSAEILGTFLLRQTIASGLPPPGYSKTRPHVWALSLPTGAVHFFQVGTPEIVREFVTTANYWSARLSKEPMVGGISNIEYGWGESIIDTSFLNVEKNASLSIVVGSGPRPSLQSSIRSARSSIDQGSFKPRLPGDKVVITEWTPPQQSLVASVLMEVDQLKALLAYVKNITEDLKKHNDLRGAMLLAFSPRHPNNTKAMANWERKSSYLLHEIVKFGTYIDCLQAAQVQKEKIYADRGNLAPAENASTAGSESTQT